MSFWDGAKWVADPARPATGPAGIRRVAGQALGALAEAGLIATLVAGLVVGTVLAKGSATAPWIALSSVDGTAAATMQPKLGDSVKFAAGYPTNTKNPWVSLTCVQDGVLVYGEGGSPTHTFVLGGASSDWLTLGGPASCTADLGDLYWKGGHEYYTYLASTSFTAGG